MPTTQRQRGRPRDDQKDIHILAVAAEQFVLRGYHATTIDQIAQAAGVGKQSIYRRWRSKSNLTLVLLREQASREIPTDQGLQEFLFRTCRAMEKSGPLLRAIMAESQRDEILLAALKSELIEPRRQNLRIVLQTMQDPALRESLIQWAIAAIFGALWYRLLLNEPLDLTFARGLISLVTNQET